MVNRPSAIRRRFDQTADGVRRAAGKMLGMPLHAEEEAPVRGLHPFDDAVIRARGDDQPGRGTIHSLMMEAVHSDAVRTDERMQTCAGINVICI